METQIYVNLLMSKKSCRRGHRNRSAVSVTRITVDIGYPNEVNPHCCRSPNLPKATAKCSFSPNHGGHKTIEVEFRIGVERPLLLRSR